MTQHHERSTPYGSCDEVGEHFRALRDSGVKTVSLTCPLADATLLSEILMQARRFELTIYEVHAEPGALLRDDSRRPALERLHRPYSDLNVRAVPVERLIVHLRLCDTTSYHAALASMTELVPQAQLLRKYYCVAVRSRLRLSHFDGEMLADVVTGLADAGSDEIELRIGLPEIEGPELAGLRQQLAAFCDRQISRHPAVRIAGLPFCLLPADHFRPCYRNLRTEIPSHAHVFRQHAMVRSIKGTDHAYHEPCRACRRRSACYRMTDIAEHPEYVPYLDPSREAAVAFVGGSLTKADIQSCASDDIVFTAPAEQGDVFAAILEGFQTILLFDGYLVQRYALTTFEVLIALLENINVFGAASLGALRALELVNFGMRGSGYVFSFLRSRKVAPYHVVVQTYDADDRPRTEPLIVIHRFLDVALEEGIISVSDRDNCYLVAERLHFSELSFRRLFCSWERSGSVSSGAALRLREFYAQQGPDAFDIKRQDALGVLQSFREDIRRDGPDFSARTALAARDVYLERLRAKYPDPHISDSSLPAGSRRLPASADASASREQPVHLTIRRAERFFADLDVVVSDTSLVDRTKYHMVNVVFIPMFFLEYGNSVGSGYGATVEQALVSAYCELLERIPCGRLRTQFIDRDELRTPIYPFRRLPFYTSLDPKMERFFLGHDGLLLDRDYVECTELYSGEIVALPKHGARLPNSCGMATGNSLVEAVLYGLYEVIEHDVQACYEAAPLMEKLRHVNLDPCSAEDEEMMCLVTDLTGRGHRVHFFNLLNRYDIPTVLAVFYDSDRELLFSGHCARLSLRDAMRHSFHEALNGHFVSCFGSRDDWRGFEQQSTAPPLQFLERFIGPARTFSGGAEQRLSLHRQLDVVLQRLRRQGLECAFAINLSPRTEFELAVAKVIVPGMDYRSGGRRSPSYHGKCSETYKLLQQWAAGNDIAAGEWSLPGEFVRARQRFFKA